MHDQPVVQSAPPRKAAAYIRMSTEHQNYSLEHQAAKLAEYALAHDLVIVTTYRDAGKSGLAISGRDGLAQLIHDVQRDGAAAFETILVYDVSRWGRFQDVDESAYYEYLCRRSGVRIEYCAEMFVNDDSPISSLLKSIKRTMAAEYSRELGAKVFHAQCRLATIGFKQGGSAGYGLRRLVVSASGEEIGSLLPGQHKGYSTDRVIYGVGTPAEVAIVRRIYRLYLAKKMTQTDIARLLNKEGVATHTARPWTLYAIKSILSNEKYTGTVVYNRKSTKLRRSAIRNPKDAWVRHTGAFRAIVSKSTFDSAQRERAKRLHIKSRDELLEGLRSIYARYGRVNGELLKPAGLPNSKIFSLRFGSLGLAYVSAGLPSTPYINTALTKHRIAEFKRSTVETMLEMIRTAGATVQVTTSKSQFVINETVRLSVAVVRCRRAWGRVNWRLPVFAGSETDFVLATLLADRNTDVQGFYLFPAAFLENVRTVLLRDIDNLIGCYRYPTLASVFGIEPVEDG
jgi:DNA invertase Pin-like site-specific DNA recombinase